jgi:imidazolonepropionase-like amidohydrolase
MIKPLLIIVCALAAVSHAQVASGPRVELVIQNVSILDLHNATWQRGRDIVVRGTRIADIRRTGGVLPPSKVTIHGNGKFVIPGLFDNRIHLASFTPADAGVIVAHGVTSVWDVGTDQRRIADWQQQISHGKFMGPRIIGTDGGVTAGVTLPASGADSPETGGVGVHHALDQLVRVRGATPAAAIGAATIRSAAHHGRDGELGSVEAGKIADLIVLTNDPLADIAHTRSIDAVVFRGEVLSRAHLNILLARRPQAGPRR